MPFTAATVDVLYFIRLLKAVWPLYLTNICNEGLVVMAE